jgi:hypothetical protein
LRHGSAYGKASIKKGGRHAAPKRGRQRALGQQRAPGQLNKLVKRASLVAPAAAVAGVVVAAATAHGMATDTLSDAAGHVAASAHADASASSAKSGSGQANRAAASKTAGGRRTAQPHGSATKPHRSARGPLHSPRPTASAKRAKRNARPTLKCSGSSVMLPANYETIVRYLSAHGYTRMAAAGMAGNIYQESKGNPESVGTGGGGLIGWTPLPPGFVTGNAAADLRTQLAQILTYNQQWAQYIPALNAATSATQAADIYMNYFERPGIPAAYNREAAAAAVASACGF